MENWREVGTQASQEDAWPVGLSVIRRIHLCSEDVADCTPL